MKKISKNYLLRAAFTMLELVFVIVVIGVLAAAIIPNTRTNPVQEAAIQLVSHIRYTQHLAMMDDKYNAADLNWYKGRWQIIFYDGNNSNYVPAYTVFSDAFGTSTYSGNPNVGEIAIDPQNPNVLMSGGYSGSVSLDVIHSSFQGTKKMNLGMTYGITSYQLSGGCSGARVSFDYMGRPINGDHNTMTGPYLAGTQRLITSNCLITITDGTESAIITIRPETGYASVAY
ncbi:MAG: prepilin-type N-terminal cleavage/methylation domain-containing protein [Sulfurimonas sp.]|nr:prepilin-type N-terminal cleavage/methylation domain-containing protein [Sulfurimonas sp.]MDD3060281.1 prepilin-type N-terminal cleavage/methylation domain-containing protein [Sulfurimonas sp.]MDD5203177.1 prepilin-type N-terminal cleavage/methylation domain-containing protein [Sulfurimonas sp.]